MLSLPERLKVILIDQYLSYGEILASRPGAWIVKKNVFKCMQSQNFKTNLILKFKSMNRTCFVFMIALTVYEKRTYIDARYGGTYPDKKRLQ